MWIDSGDDDDDGDGEDDVDDAVVEDVDGDHDGDDPSASVNAFPPLPFSFLLCMWMRADKSVGLLSLFIGHESDHWCFRLSFTNIANAVRSLPTHNFIVKEDSGPKIHSGFHYQTITTTV